MDRAVRHGMGLFLWALASSALAPSVLAQQTTQIEQLKFDTNVTPGSSVKPVQLRALLYIPTHVVLPMPAIVITPSSGGVRDDIEIHYASALARSGIAALVIDSLGSRSVASTVHDQRLVSNFHVANDAIAGLRHLTGDTRFKRDRIGVLGLSKGGIAAMHTALTGFLRLTGTSDVRFAAHVAIAPHCGWVPRTHTTTGSPILFQLAELDDQCPAEDCRLYAERLTAAGNSNIDVIVYEGAHHAWEVLGNQPHFDRWAENYARCKAILDEDGTSTAPDGTRVPPAEWHTWAKANCMSLGTKCCGGGEAQKKRATGDVIVFLRKHGF